MTHSLQQLHTTAKAIALRYGYDFEHVTLETEVGLSETAGKVTMDCLIRIIAKNSKGIQADWKIFAKATSPARVLDEFEEDLQQKSGKLLDDLTFEVIPDDSGSERTR